MGKTPSLRRPGRGPRPLLASPVRFSSAVVSPTPGVGSIVFAGFAPTVTAAASLNYNYTLGRRRVPGRGPWPLIPDVVRFSSAVVSPTPGVGSVVFTGFAPTVPASAPLDYNYTLGRRRVPGRGPWPLIPDVVRANAIVTTATPGAGSIVFTGFAPRVDETALPGAGSVVFTGQAPRVDETTLPGAGSVVFTGFAPRVDEALLPGAGSVVFTGLAPTPASASLVAWPPPRYVGRGPRPLVPKPVVAQLIGQIAPSAGIVLFSGFAPRVDLTAPPGAGSVVFTGLAPSVDETALPGAGSLVFTGAAPTVTNGASGGTTAAPGAGSVAFTGYPPSLVSIFAPSKGGPDEDRRYRELDRRLRDEDDIESLLLVMV